MEKGAGRYWTEDEIRALISVWSEKNIRNQLHGTLRNKGLFMYIAKRLQQLGVFRDWKQCRAKYKNLKYEYRAIKCSHGTGDVGKLRFYDELDAILGSAETAAQLIEDEESLNLENETKLDPAKAEVLTGDPRRRDKDNALMIPPVSNEGGKHWTTREIRALINIWSDKNICWHLKGTVRNQRIFEHIAKLLQQAGIDRDWRQCRTKYKNLKHEYAVVKKAQESGDKSKTMKFFSELDAILSNKPPGSKKGLNVGNKPAPVSFAGSTAEKGSSGGSSTCSNADKINYSSVRRWIAEPNIITSVSRQGEDLHTDSNEQLTHTQNTDSEPLKPTVSMEAGKHWTTEEIKALLTVWSDRRIRKQLQGTVRNRKIFEHIASLLQKLGVDRDWRQCRTKYKNLKHEYIVTKKALDSGYPSKSMKFFNELDGILQSKVSERPSQSDTKQRETMLTTMDSTEGAPTTDNPSELLVERNGNLHTSNIKEEVPFTEEEDSVSNISEVSAAPDIKMEDNVIENSDLHDEGNFRIVTVNEVGAGRNWSDHEIRSLLHVWSDERICRQLEGTFRNKELFEEISQRMMEFGINRDWKQCRTKYKNLKYEYYGLRKDAEQQIPIGKTMKFFDEIDRIMQKLPKGSAHGGSDPCKWSSTGQSNSEDTQTTHTTTQAEDKIIDPNEDHKLALSIKRKASPTVSPVPIKRMNSEPTWVQNHDLSASDLTPLWREDENKSTVSKSSLQGDQQNVGDEHQRSYQTAHQHFTTKVSPQTSVGTFLMKREVTFISCI